MTTREGKVLQIEVNRSDVWYVSVFPVKSNGLRHAAMYDYENNIIEWFEIKTE